MTVKLMIDELLEKRAKTSYWLAKEAKISHAIMWKLRHGKLASIRFDYIERLCAVLECEPGELFVTVVDSKSTSARKRAGKRKL